MLPERHRERPRVFGASLELNVQEDVEVLLRSWQAIVRSHRLLAREIHKPAPREPSLAKAEAEKRLPARAATFLKPAR
jgi:hypothetical protein